LEDKSERINNIANALDLGFSDFYKNENVRDLTLSTKLDTLEKAVELMTFEESMNFSVFSKMGDKHPTAEIYSIDFPSDFRASFYLLLGRYYRQAILCLRNWLEVRLTGIYFALINKNIDAYEDWKKGNARAPITKGLVRKIFSLAIFSKNTEYRERLDTLMNELSGFTHCGILKKYNLQSNTDNVPRFNPDSVNLWYSYVSRVFSEIVFSYYVAYGKNAFATMNPTELDVLRRHLLRDYLEQLQQSAIL
jgi:hypothetical protein